jgi:hypothetical protein
LANIQSIVCGGFDAVGAPCSATLLQINVWHVFVGLIVFVLVSVGVWLFRRPNRLDKHSKVLQAKTPYGASPEVRTLRLHPHVMAKALNEPGYDSLTKMDAAAKLNEKYGQRYFVVQVREGGRKLFSKELKVVAWWRSLSEAEFQTDPETLAQIKRGSASKEDDELGDTYGADGTFDIFFRKVRWWDLRHWLNHPAREIRYALYVAIFAAALEYSGDIIELLSQLFSAPGA